MTERRLIATAREVRGMLDGTITQIEEAARLLGRELKRIEAARKAGG